MVDALLFVNLLIPLPSMKWLSLLLASYILTLALMDCADVMSSNCAVEIQELVSVVDHGDGHEHSHTSESLDTCSPLCTCHCCHVHVTLNDLIQHNTLLELPNSTPSYLNTLKDIPYFDFFVPPPASD